MAKSLTLCAPSSSLTIGGSDAVNVGFLLGTPPTSAVKSSIETIWSVVLTNSIRETSNGNVICWNAAAGSESVFDPICSSAALKAVIARDPWAALSRSRA